MGDKPTPKHTINRINNDGDYTPENCEWATPSDQSKNTRLRADNKSGYKGITWDNSRQLWRAYTGGGKNRIELGYFDKIEDAVRIRAEVM